MTISSTPQLLTDVADRVAVVTLNRPEARNALSGALIGKLYAEMSRLETDDAVDVIILTGADPAFCAGLDLHAGANGDPTLLGAVRTLRSPFPPMTKPIIGAVNGPAVTGGFEIALNCTFLVASDRARFADTHAIIGMQPSWGLTVLLAQAVGLRRAREISATGNFINPEQASAWGLVNHVVAHDLLLPFCRRLATDIANIDSVSLRTLLSTYDIVGALAGGGAREHEHEVAQRWLAERYEASEIGRRRSAVMARGREQIGAVGQD